MHSIDINSCVRANQIIVLTTSNNKDLEISVYYCTMDAISLKWNATSLCNNKVMDILNRTCLMGKIIDTKDIFIQEYVKYTMKKFPTQ